MGIKGLWGVLTPYSEKKSLHEVGWSYFDNVHFPSEVLHLKWNELQIRGEKLAVDLSGWICDSQNVTDYYVQPKLYLRLVK